MKSRCLMFLLVPMLAAGVLFTAAGPVAAHHAVAPFYDLTKTVEHEGVVTRWSFRNPHALVFVEVTDPTTGKKTEWEIELGAPAISSRQGWSPDTLKVGDRIRFAGSPSRAPGTFGISAMAGGRLFRPDGTRVVPTVTGN